MRMIMAAVLLLSAILLSASQEQYVRPRRPERIENPDQVSHYIKELQNFYGVHGRGRFGKRQMHIADTSVMFSETPFFEFGGEDIFKKLWT